MIGYGQISALCKLWNERFLNRNKQGLHGLFAKSEKLGLCHLHGDEQNEMHQGGDDMLKTQLNISLDKELADFVNIYAQENRITASELITQFILGLKRQTREDSTDVILSNPEFCQAVKDVQRKLRDGSAEWHTFEEVFGK